MMPGAAALCHGGRLAEARRRFPQAPAPFLDLSTGINPIPYPLPDLPEALFSRLPEPEAEAALLAVAAATYGAAHPGLLAAAPGTQALVGLLPRLRPAGTVAVLAPTYAEHAAAWRLGGHHVREVADLDAAAGADVVVLCNPNNPDGRQHAAADLLTLAASLRARGGWLVVDEAFADFVPAGLSLAGALPPDGVVVLRSFGKAYGLAGLRVGFALAAPALAALLRATLGPWAISGPALAVATAALRDTAWRDDARRRLARHAARLDVVLVGAGLAVLGGTTLFRLAEHPAASALCERLGRAGILVRRFPDHPRWLRFGLPADDDGLERLRTALGGDCVNSW